LLADDAERLAVLLGVGVVDLRELTESADNGPADDVGVGDFALADDGALLIYELAVFVEHTDLDYALGGRRGNGEAGHHVFGDLGRDASEWGQFLVRGYGYGRERKLGCGRGYVRGVAVLRRCAVARGCRGGGVAIGVEDLFPALVDVLLVVEVGLVQLFFEPAIDAGGRVTLFGHGEVFQRARKSQYGRKRPYCSSFIITPLMQVRGYCLSGDELSGGASSSAGASSGF
jgi:hypothetical protein